MVAGPGSRHCGRMLGGPTPTVWLDARIGMKDKMNATRRVKGAVVDCLTATERIFTTAPLILDASPAEPGGLPLTLVCLR